MTDDQRQIMMQFDSRVATGQAVIASHEDLRERAAKVADEFGMPEIANKIRTIMLGEPPPVMTLQGAG